MKNYFKSNLDGKEFFKSYIVLFIPLALLLVIMRVPTLMHSRLSVVLFLVVDLLYFILYSVFYLVIIRYAVSRICFNEQKLGYNGSIGEIVPKVIKWTLLTIVTIGIYHPWYLRNYINFVLERVTYEDQNASFLSSPAKLLKAILLVFVLPLIVLVAIFVFFMVWRVRNTFGIPGSMQTTVMTFIMVIAIFLLIIPFTYYFTAWFVNFKFRDKNVKFSRSLAETTGFLLPQILLSMVTFGIYYPAAIVKIIRYVIDGSIILDENGNQCGSLSFDGSAGQGFCLIWGQSLLTLVTIGIYGSWAICKLTNWYVNNTAIELTQNTYDR